MKYRVVSTSDWISTSRLRKKAEEIINNETAKGWKLISVSLGFNVWWIPTVFITLAQ